MTELELKAGPQIIERTQRNKRKVVTCRVCRECIYTTKFDTKPEIDCGRSQYDQCAEDYSLGYTYPKNVSEFKTK